MTKKLNKYQCQVLQQLIEKKIGEAEGWISKQEAEKLKKAENTPSEDVRKIFKEYNKTFDKYLKLEKRMKELNEQLEKKRWYISIYDAKPKLIMHYEHPIWREIMAKTKEKADKLAALKEQLKLEIAFLDKNLNIIEYLNKIDEKIQDTLK
jgi:exonuclease VII large subunit